MDAELGAETQASGPCGVALYRSFIVQCLRHAVHGCIQSGRARGQHQLRSEVEQGVVVTFDAEIHLEVDGPEDQPLDAGRVAIVRRESKPAALSIKGSNRFPGRQAAT